MRGSDLESIQVRAFSNGNPIESKSVDVATVVDFHRANRAGEPPFLEQVAAPAHLAGHRQAGPRRFRLVGVLRSGTIALRRTTTSDYPMAAGPGPPWCGPCRRCDEDEV